MVDFGSLAGPGGPGDPFKRWGAKPPHLLEGSPGSPGPKNRSFPGPGRVCFTSSPPYIGSLYWVWACDGRVKGRHAWASSCVFSPGAVRLPVIGPIGALKANKGQTKGSKITKNVKKHHFLGVPRASPGPPPGPGGGPGCEAPRERASPYSTNCFFMFFKVYDVF